MFPWRQLAYADVDDVRANRIQHPRRPSCLVLLGPVEARHHIVVVYRLAKRTEVCARGSLIDGQRRGHRTLGRQSERHLTLALLLQQAAQSVVHVVGLHCANPLGELILLERRALRLEELRDAQRGRARVPEREAARQRQRPRGPEREAARQRQRRARRLASSLAAGPPLPRRLFCSPWASQARGRDETREARGPKRLTVTTDDDDHGDDTMTMTLFPPSSPPRPCPPLPPSPPPVPPRPSPRLPPSALPASIPLPSPRKQRLRPRW